MNPIIYVDGKLADHFGLTVLREIAKLAAERAQMPVDVMTHGFSSFHANRRITGEPPCTTSS